MMTLRSMILISILLLAGLAAHGDSNTNYDGIFNNEDGSVLIVTPRFANPENQNMKLSDQSDVGAVCAKYGFTAYVPNSLKYASVNSSEEMVRLGSDGKFAQYDSGSSYNAIGELFCSNVQSSSYAVSTSIATKNLNDDGSYWISGLTLHFDNQDLQISDQTDLNVVCNRFGFSAYVPNSIKYVGVGSKDELVRLDSTSHFAQYDSGSSYNAIGELICTP
jgi:hypothetical protein